TVLATMLAVTFLAYWWGPPLPFRFGEVYPNDLRVRAYFEVVKQAQTEQAREEAVQRLPEDERADPAAREAARLAVPPIIEKYPVGMPLVQRGQPIGLTQIHLLQEEHRAYLASMQGSDHARRGVALFLVMALLATVVVLYGSRFQQALAQSLTKISGVCALILITLAAALLLSGPP